jgi:hypothetical protein
MPRLRIGKAAKKVSHNFIHLNLIFFSCYSFCFLGFCIFPRRSSGYSEKDHSRRYSVSIQKVVFFNVQRTSSIQLEHFPPFCIRQERARLRFLRGNLDSDSNATGQSELHKAGDCSRGEWTQKVQDTFQTDLHFS